MTRRFGIDTSVLVRLLTGEPEADFALCVHKLRSLIEKEGAEILVSNQVVGEAYIAVQHHYGVSRDGARAGLLDVPRSGLAAIEAPGCGSPRQTHRRRLRPLRAGSADARELPPHPFHVQLCNAGGA